MATKLEQIMEANSGETVDVSAERSATDANEDSPRVEFGPDFLSRVCIEATHAPGIEPFKISSSGSTTEDTHTDTSSDQDDSSLVDAAEISYEDDDDCSVQSNASSKSVDSTRMLLRQAHARMHRQSIYEEVQHLRTLVSGHETHSKLLEKQNAHLVTKYDELEFAYISALEQIHQYKMKEQRIKEEQAGRELEYMNQMNEVCRTYDAREQDYMGQLIQKDAIIVDLQNKLNEIEFGTRRKQLQKEGKEVCDAVSELETAIRMAEMNDSEDESDASVEYI
ncbi:hypothetical protein ACHAXN_008185 [Cyclotella atomus]